MDGRWCHVLRYKCLRNTFVFLLAGGLMMGKASQFRFGHCEFCCLWDTQGQINAKEKTGLKGLDMRADVSVGNICVRATVLGYLLNLNKTFSSEAFWHDQAQIYQHIWLFLGPSVSTLNHYKVTSGLWVRLRIDIITYNFYPVAVRWEVDCSLHH